MEESKSLNHCATSCQANIHMSCYVGKNIISIVLNYLYFIALFSIEVSVI